MVKIYNQGYNHKIGRFSSSLPSLQSPIYSKKPKIGNFVRNIKKKMKTNKKTKQGGKKKKVTKE